MADPKTYTRVTEADTMIEKLVEKEPEMLWAVTPSQIVVMGIDNKDRSEKTVAKQPIYSKLSLIKGAEKALLQSEGIPVFYIIEIYWSDWHRWSTGLKQMVIVDCLLEITAEAEKKNRPDCIGFRILYDALGVHWDCDPDGVGLPDFLDPDCSVKFDMSLRPGLNDVENHDNHDEDDEE